MHVRSIAVLAALGVASAAASPALARKAAPPAAKLALRHAGGIDPARVLAGGGRRGFAGRADSLSSIIGGEAGAGPLRIPLRPEHPRSLHREADASAAAR